MSNGLPKPLKGIVPPMLTPLLDRDTLDEPGLERLIEHIVGGGVHGLFLLGTTGEAPSLSHALRKRLIRRACELVADRVPVLVGVTDTSFVESVKMAEFAADAGANAVVVAPPYYFPAGQPELIEYLEHLAPAMPLPVFLYNMPSHTKLTFDPGTVLRASELENVRGIKDSSGDMVYFHELIEALGDRPDFTFLTGPEELLAEAVLLGGDGGVCGGANVQPQLYVDLYEAAERRDLDAVARLHHRVMRIHMTLYRVGKHSSSLIKGIKCALSLMGICNDFMAEPFHRFREAERETVRGYLAELGLL